MRRETLAQERKKKKTQAENVWRRQLLLSSRMNTTFAKLFLTFNTGSSCSPLALGDVRLTAVDDVGIKCSNFPDTHERHVPSSSIMTPRLPALQLHLFGYNSLPSVSHWTHSSTNRFLWLRIDTGKSEVISRLMRSVCSDLKE